MVPQLELKKLKAMPSMSYYLYRPLALFGGSSEAVLLRRRYAINHEQCGPRPPPMNRRRACAMRHRGDRDGSTPVLPPLTYPVDGICYTALTPGGQIRYFRTDLKTDTRDRHFHLSLLFTPAYAR
jgi:hypothetical protein